MRLPATRPRVRDLEGAQHIAAPRFGGRHGALAWRGAAPDQGKGIKGEIEIARPPAGKSRHQVQSVGMLEGQDRAGLFSS